METSLDGSLTQQDASVSSSPLSIELNGINVIEENERHGKPSSLFWPWFAGNVSVLSIPFGAWVLGMGLSVWQAVAMGVIGVIAGFVLVGFVSLMGKKGSAPTMILSRASFGVRGNAVPGVISYVSLIGWETINVVLATAATATVFKQLTGAGGNAPKIIGFAFTLALTVAAGIIGHRLIMRLQAYLSVILAVMTVGYIALTWRHIDFHALSQLKGGSWQAMAGGAILVVTALGVGYVNIAADFSRYLPRHASGRAVVGWTTLGASAAPVILVTLGIFLTGSNAKLGMAIAGDPVGAFAALLPTWYLIPFILVVVCGLASGAILGLYSSGLNLLALGLPVKRWAAAGIDGVLMAVGTVVVVWFAPDIQGPFQSFLVTLGVPLAAWCGIVVTNTLLRRRDFAQKDLFDARGVYGAVNWASVAGLVVFTAIGWGLVTSEVGWLHWQGFLFSPLHLGSVWQASGIGVIVALAGGVVTGLAGLPAIRRQERRLLKLV